MTTTQAHNVLATANKTVYLNAPRDMAPEEDEDKTEPLNPSENGTPTSAALTPEEENYKKRYDDATKYIRDLKATYESQISEIRAELSDKTSKLVSATPEFKLPKTVEEWQEFENKYPELAAMITTKAVMVAKELNGKTNDVVAAKLKQLEQEQNALRAEKGVQELKKYHPDFEQIKDDPRFIDWFNAQPTEIKNLIRSTNPQVIAAGLDKFKEYAGIKTQVQKQEEKKNATREVKTPTGRVQIGEGGKRTYTSAEINKMSITEFAKNEVDIVAAQYDGRIVG